jgi:hypothetical protein
MPEESNKEAIQNIITEVADMNMNQIIQSVPDIFKFIPNPQSVEMKQVRAAFLSRASELGDKTLIRSIFTACEREIKKKESLETIRFNRDMQPAFLDFDEKGKPKESIENFFRIMTTDQHYRSVRYNLMTNSAEVIRKTIDGENLVKWSDTEDAESRNVIESEYHLYSPQKHSDALRMLFKQREYNPILELIEGIEWDGENRIEHCLTEWMKAEDSDYTREVSRLIFAGGINRIYHPGCKFDDVPVLVGTKQGEGKSTFIKWLAINEQWFTEIKKVDGSDSIEQLFGAWVCEIPELSAFKKAGDVESIKAYITRTKDKYRKPYDKSPVEYPRRCLFIGTTNSDRFLTDKSGNRRFYPVTVRSSGYDLFDHEKECKEYIIQCWAEARERFKAGNMPPFADYHLIKEYQKMQDEAMEDDWRVGKIASYLEHFVPGTKICAIQIYKECLYPESSAGPKPYESREIGQIIGKIDGWEKLPSRYYADKYGQQRGWIKNENAKVSNADELPF